jgi:tetratricopeptide (TPR) repeat protein
MMDYNRNWILLAVSLLFFVSCNPMRAPSQQSLEQYLEAQRFYQQQEIESAKDILIEIIKTEKRRFPQATLLLGRIHYLEEEWNQAELLFGDLFEKSPEYHEAGLWLAKTLIQKEDLDSAQSLLEDLLSKDSEDPRLLFQMARIYALMENYSQALGFYNGTNQYSEEIALSHLKMGEIYMLLGDTAKALYEVTKAVETIPPQSEMEDSIISLYRELRQEAIQ